MSTYLGVVALAGDEEVPAYLPAIADEPFLERESRYADDGSRLHNRLRIAVPEDGLEQQPWPAWGGKGWVAFAGRLADRDNLAGMLGLATAQGVSDGRLAALAFEAWGAGAPGRFHGDYAVAAWHGTERRLILAADPLANRGLFHVRRGNLVWFATSIRPLLAVRDVPRAVDEETIIDLLTYNRFDSDRTVFRAVRKVIAGTSTILTATRAETVAFHRFDPERRVKLRRDAEYVEAAWELLDRAVAERLRAVGPVPISGSGGLDSACIAVSAARAGRPVHFLTMVPDPAWPAHAHRTAYVDESERVRALAAAVPGLQPEFLPARLDPDWSPDAPALLAAEGVPTDRASQLAWFAEVYRHAGAVLGARGILSGGVGNHTLTWEGLRLPAQYLREGRWGALLRDVLLQGRGGLRRMARMVKWEVLPYRRNPRFVPDGLTDILCVNPQALQEHAVLERMARHGNDPEWRFTTNDRQMRIHLLHRNRSFRAESTGQLRALHGVDYMAPIGDLRLIEFCLAIPEDQFRRNGQSRLLARRMLEVAGVPPAIAWDEQRGIQNPEWFAMLSRARPSFPDLIARLRRNATAARLIDIDRLETVAADWPADAATAQRKAAILRSGLAFALNVGSFIAWAEGTN